MKNKRDINSNKPSMDS